VELSARFQEFERIHQGRMNRGLIPYKSIGITLKLQISKEIFIFSQPKSIRNKTVAITQTREKCRSNRTYRLVNRSYALKDVKEI